MSSISLGTPINPWGWKAAALACASMVVILFVAVGVEGYFLYQTTIKEPVILPKAAVVSPSLTGPKTKLFDDDWNVPLLVPPAMGTAGFSSTQTTDPWEEMNALHQKMDQLFNQTMSQFPISDQAAAVASPNVDIRDDKDHYTVRLDMPGADKSTFKVSVDDGRILRIAADRTSENETKDGNTIVKSERSMSHFERDLELPGPVKASGIDAKYNDGVLTISLPKAPASDSSTKVDVHQ